MLTAYIDPNAKPSIDIFNKLNKALPKGIYSGGAVIQGPGRLVTIEAFTAKSPDNFIIEGDTQNIEIPVYPLQSWALVLYSKSWVPGVIPKAHAMAFRVIAWNTYQTDPDLAYYILFARIDALSAEARILPTEIITSYAERVNLLNLSSSQLLSGSGNFNGPSGSVVYHYLNNSAYKLQLTPSELPNAGLGDIWAIKQPGYFTVYCNGAVTTKFDWSITVSQASLGADAQTVFGSKFGKALVQNPVPILNSLNVDNYLLIPANLGVYEPLSPIPYTIHTTHQATLYSPGAASPIPFIWELVSNVGRTDLIITNFRMSHNTGTYNYPQVVLADSLRVFAYPEGAYTNPILIVENALDGTVDITLNANVHDSTNAKLAIFTNPGAYPHGSSTGVGTVEVVHNLNLDSYVPFLAFTDITGGTLTGYNVEVGRNSFKIILPTSVSVAFNWLIVPSYTA
jgi:hypothetical protein